MLRRKPILDIQVTDNGRIVKESGQIYSGLVQLSMNLPESLRELRGKQAQAFGVRGTKTLMQIYDADPYADTVVGQFTEMAASLGLDSSLFGWPDAKLKALRMKALKVKGKYSANAVCDTGADISITFDETIETRIKSNSWKRIRINY